MQSAAGHATNTTRRSRLWHVHPVPTPCSFTTCMWARPCPAAYCPHYSRSSAPAAPCQRSTSRTRVSRRATHSTTAARSGDGTTASSDTQQRPRQSKAPPKSTKSWTRVPACPDTCACNAQLHWCHFPVAIDHRGNQGWEQAFQEPPEQYKKTSYGVGFDHYVSQSGLQIYLVKDAAYAKAAINRLKGSMKDSVIAIDLEWKPDRYPGSNNKVAVVQLASAHVCVILQTSQMDFRLPQCVVDFLADPEVHVVGFAWRSSDEHKMQSTFKLGREDIGNLCDFQDIAQRIGYAGGGQGLDVLTQRILGCSIDKSKKLSRSNWGMNNLRLAQIKYAAMDVFSLGQIFRQARVHHRLPSTCSECQAPVGDLTPVQIMHEPTGEVFRNLREYRMACTANNWPIVLTRCTTCGRPKKIPEQPEAPPSAEQPEAPPTVAQG